MQVEFSGAVYHVVNLGKRRDRVFSSDADYMLLMEKLVRFAELFEVVIYSLLPDVQPFSSPLKDKVLKRELQNIRNAIEKRGVPLFLTFFELGFMEGRALSRPPYTTTTERVPPPAMHITIHSELLVLRLALFKMHYIFRL